MTTRTCQDNPLPTGCFLSAECSKENSKLSYLLRPLVRLVDGGMPPVCDRPHGNRRTVFPSFFTGGQIGCSNGSKSSGSNSCSLARSSCHAPKPGEGDATPPTTPSVETPTAAAAAFAAAPAFLSDASIFPAGAKANDDARALIDLIQGSFATNSSVAVALRRRSTLMPSPPSPREGGRFRLPELFHPPSLLLLGRPSGQSGCWQLFLPSRCASLMVAALPPSVGLAV